MLIFLYLIFKTNFSCSSSILKCFSSSLITLSPDVFLTTSIALSISSSIFSKPSYKCTFLDRLSISLLTTRTTLCLRYSVHLAIITLTPNTLSLSSANTLILTLYLLSNAVYLYNNSVFNLVSAFFLSVINTLIPFKSVKSFTFLTSGKVLFLTPLIISSIIFSRVVPYGISFIVISFLLTSILPLSVTVPIPLSNILLNCSLLFSI